MYLDPWEPPSSQNPFSSIAIPHISMSSPQNPFSSIAIPHISISSPQALVKSEPPESPISSFEYSTPALTQPSLPSVRETEIESKPINRYHSREKKEDDEDYQHHEEEIIPPKRKRGRPVFIYNVLYLEKK